MPVETGPPIVRISPRPPVFDLPERVALDEGLFEAAGLEARFGADIVDRDPTERNVLERLTESTFERGEADVYNVCEWGTIDRVERSKKQARVYELRPAIVAQAIVSFEDAIQEPRDLAGVPIAVNEFTGSHYTTLQMLGEVLPHHEVTIEHIGVAERRLEAARTGLVRAATVMEPFVSLALKQGAHIVSFVFYRGAHVVAPNLSVSERAAYVSAVNAAVDRIRGNFGAYKRYIVANTRGALAPHELSDHFVRYIHVEPFPVERFAQTYDWMKSWGLTEGVNDPATLLDG